MHGDLRIGDLVVSVEEAADLLRAIRAGDVDAVVVDGAAGSEVRTFRDPGHAYRLLVEAMSEGAALVNPDGVVVYANPHFVTLTGAAGGVVSGSSLAAWVAPEDATALQSLLVRAHAGVVRDEVKLRSVDAPLPILLSVTPVYFEGNPLFCVVAVDIGEHRRQEDLYRAARADLEARDRDLRAHQIQLEAQNEELRNAQRALEHSRTRYVDLYNLAPVAYLTLDKQGLIVEANQTATQLLGASGPALIERSLTEFIAPEDQDAYYLYRRRPGSLCDLRLIPRGEAAGVDVDGGRVWVRLEAKAGTDSRGRPVLRVVLLDSRERRRNEATLRASEARHRALFEQSRDALMTLSPPDWRFTSGNAVTLALFGVADVAALTATTLWEHSPPLQPGGGDSAEKLRALLTVALAHGSCFFDWTFQRSSGETFPATVLVTQVDVDGQTLVQATVRDETEVHRLHAHVRQTDRLASMGMVAAGVAHEINNPLAHVLYNVESLARDLARISEATQRCTTVVMQHLGPGAVDDILGDDAVMLSPAALSDAVDRAREAVRSTERIRAIARALSSFSRVESGELASIDVNRAIEVAIGIAMGEVKYRARLVKELGLLPPVRASEGKLAQVFLNLLLNAAHAIDVPDVDSHRIMVHSWAESNSVFVVVRDTGQGIAPEHLGRVFDPFFTTKPAGAGSGMGLAISRSIVSEFGGEIRVESEPGRGARFIVRLPSETPASLPRPDEVAVALLEPPQRGRVLLVDDDWGIRETIKRVLGSEHEVVVVASAEEARSLLGVEAFDLIICDLIMPRTTGLDLHEWIAAREPALARHMVFLTGGALSADMAAKLAKIGNPVIDKPFDVATLRALVSRRVAANRVVVH